jgi:hypothetical protein
MNIANYVMTRRAPEEFGAYVSTKKRLDAARARYMLTIPESEKGINISSFYWESFHLNQLFPVNDEDANWCLMPCNRFRSPQCECGRPYKYMKEDEHAEL